MKKNAMKPTRQQFYVYRYNGTIIKCLKCMSSQYCNVKPVNQITLNMNTPSVNQSVAKRQKIMVGRVELIDKFSLRNVVVTSP